MNELPKHIKAAVNNLEKQITKLRVERDKEKAKSEAALAQFEVLDVLVSKLHDNIQALKTPYNVPPQLQKD